LTKHIGRVHDGTHLEVLVTAPLPDLTPERPVLIDRQRLARSAEAQVMARPTNSYLGTCTEHDRPVRYDAPEDWGDEHLIPCPDGGPDHLIAGKRLVAVTSTFACDGSCESAIRNLCSCGCGGVNHGRAWLIKFALQMGADPEALSFGHVLSRRTVAIDAVAQWRAACQQSAAARAQRTERRRDTKERKAQTTFEAWAEQHQQVITALAPFADDSDAPEFMQRLAVQVTRGWNGRPKPLTPAQEEAALRVVADRERRRRVLAERESAKRPAPVGKVRISGRVVKVIYDSSDDRRFGPEHKMTVSCDGYAVRVTVPRPVADWARENRRGSCTATGGPVTPTT
jgi:hypothetical protein